MALMAILPFLLVGRRLPGLPEPIGSPRSASDAGEAPSGQDGTRRPPKARKSMFSQEDDVRSARSDRHDRPEIHGRSL